MPRGTEAKHVQTEVQWWQNKPQCSHRALIFQSSQKGIATMKDADRKIYIYMCVCMYIYNYAQRLALPRHCNVEGPHSQQMLLQLCIPLGRSTKVLGNIKIPPC